MPEPRLEEVFKISGVPTYTFVAPSSFPRLTVALRTPGRGVVVRVNRCAPVPDLADLLRLPGHRRLDRLVILGVRDEFRVVEESTTACFSCSAKSLVPRGPTDLAFS